MPMPAAPPPRRLTAADFDPEVLHLFDQYVHGQIDRRGFLDRTSHYGIAPPADRVAGTKARLPILPPPGHAAWLQQRHHAALRRGRRQAGLAAHRGALQGHAEWLRP